MRNHRSSVARFTSAFARAPRRRSEWSGRPLAAEELIRACATSITLPTVDAHAPEIVFRAAVRATRRCNAPSCRATLLGRSDCIGRARADGRVRGRLAAAALDRVAEFWWVRAVRPVDPAVVCAGSVTTEGDAAARVPRRSRSSRDHPPQECTAIGRLSDARAAGARLSTLPAALRSSSYGLETVPGDATLLVLKRTRIAERLIGPFGYTHVTRSFDGARLTIDRPSWNATVLASHPTAGGFEVSANRELKQVSLAGIALTAKRLPHAPPVNARLF